MSEKLHAALRAYRTALLETAAGDLFARKADQPSLAGYTVSVSVAPLRAAVLEAAKNVSAEEFTAHMMAVGFVQ